MQYIGSYWLCTINVGYQKYRRANEEKGKYKKYRTKLFGIKLPRCMVKWNFYSCVLNAALEVLSHHINIYILECTTHCILHTGLTRLPLCGAKLEKFKQMRKLWLSYTTTIQHIWIIFCIHNWKVNWEEMSLERNLLTKIDVNLSTGGSWISTFLMFGEKKNNPEITTDLRKDTFFEIRFEIKFFRRSLAE